MTSTLGYQSQTWSRQPQTLCPYLDILQESQQSRFAAHCHLLSQPPSAEQDSSLAHRKGALICRLVPPRQLPGALWENTHTQLTPGPPVGPLLANTGILQSSPEHRGTLQACMHTLPDSEHLSTGRWRHGNPLLEQPRALRGDRGTCACKVPDPGFWQHWWAPTWGLPTAAQSMQELWENMQCTQCQIPGQRTVGTKVGILRSSPECVGAEGECAQNLTPCYQWDQQAPNAGIL